MRKFLIFHLIFSLGTCYSLVYLFSFTFKGLAILAILIAVSVVFWLLTFLIHRLYFNTFKAGLNLAFYFIKELIVSNFRIIYFVLSPRHQFRPAILELPLQLKSDFSITLLANLITLTPGTITLEVSDDKKYLYFHVVDVPKQDVELAKQKIKNGFEKRIMKISS
jgi:multicomponent Na+:H+ antiporter subunit E